MAITGLANCLKCGAVVNPNWKACASCSHPTGTVKEPGNETPKNEDRPSTHIGPPLHSRDSWLSSWRELADMAQGIQEQDWRFKGIMDLLDGCDKAFEQGDWAAFQRLAEKAKTLCQKK